MDLTSFGTYKAGQRLTYKAIENYWHLPHQIRIQNIYINSYRYRVCFNNWQLKRAGFTASVNLFNLMLIKTACLSSKYSVAQDTIQNYSCKKTSHGFIKKERANGHSLISIQLFFYLPPCFIIPATPEALFCLRFS